MGQPLTWLCSAVASAVFRSVSAERSPSPKFDLLGMRGPWFDSRRVKIL